MSNFNFIKTDFPDLFADAVEAERFTFDSPKAAAVFCRSTLENAVNWLYDHDRQLVRPYRSDLSTLMHEHAFSSMFNQSMFNELNLIRKIGNQGAHGKGRSVSQEAALAALKNLFRFLRFIATYYGKNTPETQVFDEALIPKPQAVAKPLVDAKQLKKLLDKLEYKNKQARDAEEKILALAQQNNELKRERELQEQELAVRKKEREQAIDIKEIDIEKAVPLLVSEAETRKLYIDCLLAEAGWVDLQDGYHLEYEVTGMPISTNPSGIGYVDYVLWGDDGLPLAVVEAKKTLADPRKGKHQAECYADCLEAEKGQRPIIFYTSGFETYLWDDQFSPEREVQGFYTKDELQLLIERRKTRTDLRDFEVNKDIAGRAYQLEAIQRVAENTLSMTGSGELRGRARRSLLVMATGSGKTRTSAALVDMFTKCNWAKRVLFLADRNALVRQAKNAFNEHLPNLSAIDLTKEKEDHGTRLVFSTYPSIMNRIDGRRDDEERFYGVGHFDLIIIDEAHRSVYQKYRAIFDYFDAMLIGLTATPKSEVDHNTYGLFNIEDENPTFAYELDSAVNEGFLVPPKAISVPLKFVREGVKYNELSDSEKEEYEEKFGDPSNDEAPDQIERSAINKWLFNTDTVDQVLEYLMQNGVKVEGGDKLGKTIIFAKNHSHAIFIEERFNNNYPEHAGKFLRVIDNYESKAQDLLDNFTDERTEVDPQIAVSVDMMDTGVDAPRVVNLVFFKQVKSQTKFWQMIGRGTRLCPDLFSPGEDKTHFVIFDFCENFEFFDLNPDGIKGQLIKTLTQRIFEAKLEVGLLIRENKDSSQEQRELSEQYINECHQLVASLDRDRFQIKAAMRWVVEYSDKQRWQNIGKSDLLDINTHLSSLVIPTAGDDELARRFDLLMLRFEITKLTGVGDEAGYVWKLGGIADNLLKKLNIPQVADRETTLRELQNDEFWQAAGVNQIEELRVALRDLMKYVDKESQQHVVTKFEDELDAEKVTEHDLVTNYTTLQSYKDRVETYVRKNADHLVIQKLKSNKPITESELELLEKILFDKEEVGSKQDYIATYGEKPLGEFIRSIVGLDSNAAQEAFAEFIGEGNLKADQMTFVNTLIQFLTTNGVIDKAMLFEPPFTNIHDQGLFGVFDDAKASNVVKLIDRINSNASPEGFDDKAMGN